MIEDKDIRLRAVEPDDLDFLFLLESAEGAADASLNPAPVSRLMLYEYIQNYTADIFAAGQLRLVVDVKNGDGWVRAGTADISDFDALNRRGFVGIIIVPELRNCGIGRKTLDMLCRYASGRLGMHQLSSVVAVGNAASLALFKACGFRSAGRLRSWLRRGSCYEDALIFQRLF